MANYYMVFTATDTQDSAKQIAKILVTENLAACCTITLNTSSIFAWDGVVEETIEQQLMIKTTAQKVDSVINRIKELHTYDIPEVVAIPIEKGNEDYFMWMSAVVNE